MHACRELFFYAGASCRRLFQQAAKTPRLTQIYLAPAAGEPMQSVASAKVLAGQGLQGDRYALACGHWHTVESCEITLLTEYEWQRMQRRMHGTLSEGVHRRNLVVQGIKPRQLRQRSLQIGHAVLSYQRPRPPCGYIDQLTGLRLAKAMGRDSGACFKVIRGGVIRVGERIKLLS